MYNIKFISGISKNISPAVARAIEIGLISGVIYVLGAIIDGQLLSWNALAIAVITPIWSALNKYLRDNNK